MWTRIVFTSTTGTHTTYVRSDTEEQAQRYARNESRSLGVDAMCETVKFDDVPDNGGSANVDIKELPENY